MNNLQGKRRWFVRAIVLFVLVVLALELVDQWQGGPLGREYPRGGGIETLPLGVGKNVLLMDGMISDRTVLPFHIISVHSISNPSGLAIKAGMMSDPPAYMGAVIPTNEEQQKYSFVPGTVQIPANLKRISHDTFVPVLQVTAIKRGLYEVDGLWVTYRWGPMVYRAKFSSLAFKITVK